jgi:hypothetical protein
VNPRYTISHQHDLSHPVAGRWQHKKTAAEVIVTRINFRNKVSHIAADKSFSGKRRQWLVPGGPRARDGAHEEGPR